MCLKEILAWMGRTLKPKEPSITEPVAERFTSEGDMERILQLGMELARIKADNERVLSGDEQALLESLPPQTALTLLVDNPCKQNSLKPRSGRGELFPPFWWDFERRDRRKRARLKRGGSQNQVERDANNTSGILVIKS